MTYRCTVPSRRQAQPLMQLLVFAHTPPPVHGQSVMVEALVGGLARDRELKLFHVNPRLSRDAADIGRWRPGKVFALLGACLRALRLRWRHGPMYFYHVPAPARRGALYRDWVVMLLCRPFFTGVISHWHAAGLGPWLERDASFLERGMTRWLLGRTALAIVLGEALRADLAFLEPRHVEVVRNGIADPCPDFRPRSRDARQPLHALFVGLCIEEKGLYDALAGVAATHRELIRQGQPGVRLTVAGSFPSAKAEAAFLAAAKAADVDVHLAGFVTGEAKRVLFTSADVLLFPTKYPHETQGLVVAEALAFDLPVIVTRWRAVAESLPAASEGVLVVEPDRPDQISSALVQLARRPPPSGVRRQFFLSHLTLDRHLADLRSALLRAS
jgi:glycosyltransferase involved in cell wall biosynthesis